MTVAALGFLALSACGGGGGGAPADADTPEGQAFQYRQAIMRALANKMATLGEMAREEIPLDEAVFEKSVHDLVALSGMVLEGFELEGIPTGSRALPETWSNWEDFQQKSNDLEEAAQGLADAYDRGGFEAAQGLVQSTAGTCGGCHRGYRQRAE